MYWMYGMAGLAFLMVALLTPLWIKFLQRYGLTQPIRKELPADHQAKKGTPLMAGMVLFIGVILSLFTMHSGMMILLCVTFALFGVIGFADDFKKAAFQDPQGVSGKQKLLFQFLFAGAILYVLMRYFDLDPSIRIFGDISLMLPASLYAVLVLLFVVGTANAINFTDGLDGLLIQVAVPTYLFFFLISDRTEVQVFSLVMIACLLGLLLYNVYPAKAFMGDTGSLAIGGSLSFLAVLEKVEIVIPLLFLIYLAEQFSVILQVFYFKKTGRRLFRMSPIHYHYSLKYGWHERKIVFVFALVSWVMALASWLYWKFALQGSIH